MDAKDVWAAVRRLTGRQRDAPAADGVSAEILNSVRFVYVPVQMNPRTNPNEIFDLCIIC